MLYYLDAFMKLHRNRIYPDGIKPISFFDVYELGCIDGLYRGEIDYLYELLVIVDNKYVLEEQNKKMKSPHK